MRVTKNVTTNVANIDIDLICQPKGPNWPTVPPPLLKFLRKIMTKIAFSKAKKIATKFFGSEMTLPPFRKFSGNSSVLVYTGFP